MTDHVVRLYALAAAVVVFTVAWAAVAARPWAAAQAPDPRVQALAAREQRLERRGAAVAAELDRRWAAYREALAARQAQLASRPVPPVPAPAPSVRVVELPPLTATRSS